jgi:hypothetical protein
MLCDSWIQFRIRRFLLFAKLARKFVVQTRISNHAFCLLNETVE